MTIEDTATLYDDVKWTANQKVLLALLYLGAADNIDITSLFFKDTSSTDFGFEIVKPTLSPKDPNFPAWWEEHKTEWETEQ